MVRILQVTALVSLFSLVQSQVDVETKAEELYPMAQNHNDNKEVRLLVHAKNKEGKEFASKRATMVTMERKNFRYMGITAPYSLMEELRKNKDIESVDIDHEVFVIEDQNVRRRLAEEIPWGIPTVLQDIDWWNNLDADRASIKVCVVDTGYDLGHEDLPQEPDVDGTDGAGELWSYDGNSHGTHCAGTIAALGGNNKGVVGVLPNNEDSNFQLLIGKAFDASGSGYSSLTISAVQGCVDQGANVISLSLGSTRGSRTESQFYEDLYTDQDILFIAAAGNSGNTAYSYPASYPFHVSVASLEEGNRRDPDIHKSSFSQYNDQVEVAAPGSGVYSTIPDNSYGTKSGTSMATPHVAGVAGLLWMYFPDCTNKQIRHVIDATSSPLDGACDVNTGFGLVQAKDAYELLAQGDCGGTLGPDTPVGGCAELYDSDGPPDPTTTSAPTDTAPCGARGESCSVSDQCCSNTCRTRSGKCS